MAITQRTCNTDRLNAYRLAARAFVLGGAVFWTLVVFAGAIGWNSESIFLFAITGPDALQKFMAAFAAAFIWVVIAAAIFVVGLFYERIAAVLLAAAALGSIVYGAAMQWEAGLWYIVGLFIILPITISAVLYLLAAREQSACDAGAPEPARKAPAEPSV